MIAPGVFYPDGVASPEARLRYYASRFPLVEVDSTYYAVPARRVAALWAERTPDAFVFDVKAHALMTGQPTETARLPKAIRDALPVAIRGKQRLYAKDLPAELLDEAWRLFLDALDPLRATGKLGAIFLQYPRWVRPSRASAAVVEDARRRLGDRPAAVEFRHRDWLADGTRDRTLALLARNGFAYVAVDEPQGLESSVPPVSEATNPALAVVRFHGRRAEFWEGPVATVSERFRYLYDEGQLAEWVPKVLALAERAGEVHLLFNNCYANYGTTNAREMARLLGEPVSR
ncbi:MAG: DUF72 domain-containing protein [Gemmatimonadota bacterium]|nr:DUF72 domain-containing protein [Gemmatimonadota bacterium]MDE3215603.1 DUF72 domain-containing protein [Gemmatimonadota bacterium]